MKPKINIIDFRLLERSLSAAVLTVINMQVTTSYFDEDVERVRVKSVTVLSLRGYTSQSNALCRKVINQKVNHQLKIMNIPGISIFPNLSSTKRFEIL